MSRILTWMVSVVWSFLNAMIRVGIGIGLLRPVRFRARVISVGNIQAGGAGKTPLVALIAREAHERGLGVCILCRGYRGLWERLGGVILPGDPPQNAAICGDEAALLHDLAPHAFIGVGAQRTVQFTKLQELMRKSNQADPSLIILDDGFQHWKIKKDLEIVALTSASRNKSLFRDWSNALKHADLVVWTKGIKIPDGLRNPDVKIRYQLLTAVPEFPVWLITGVADGNSVYDSMVEAGFRVVKHSSFPDHARYEPKMIHGMLEEALREGWRVALTGKDWVKWRSLGVLRERVVVLELELIFERGQEIWIQKLWGK
jgi:tetraacyldisaccharide 4'-kinase